MKMLMIDSEMTVVEDLFTDLECIADALTELRDDLTSEEWDRLGANEMVCRKLSAKGVFLAAVIRHLGRVIEGVHAEFDAKTMNRALAANLNGGREHGGSMQSTLAPHHRRNC